MGYVASSVDRSDVNNVFPGRVGKTSPCKTKQTQRNQDYPKRFVHGVSVGGSQSQQSRSTLTLYSHPQTDQSALPRDRFIHFSNTFFSLFP